ncbi:PKD domain-containing protein, partial [bacterium]|nr:PKD domain-containing protein [bacterium]
MMKTTPTRFRTLAALAALLLVAAWGCTDQNTPTEPLATISLDDGAVLRGTVRGLDGLPAPDAVLALERMDGSLAGSVTRALTGDHEPAAKAAGVRSTVSDGRGRFVFGGLDQGTYLLTSSLRDHAGDSRTLDILPPAAANAETTLVDIQLTPTGTFLGNATLENAADHTGSVVFVEGTSYVAVTDAAGDYSLTGVPYGNWPVRAMHPGYLDDATSGVIAAAGDSVTLADLFLRRESNIPPTIDAISATTVSEGLATGFSGAASDADGTVVLFEWDFENDGVFDWSGASAATNFLYPAQGSYLAKLRVTDDQGAIGLAVVQVTVDPSLPTAVYVTPTGNDNDDGSQISPVATIGQGLARAVQLGVSLVLVTEGTYNEDVILQDGISLTGGLAVGTWDAQPGTYSLLTGGTRPLRATGITTATVVQGFEIVAASAVLPGQSSVAVTVWNCTSALAYTDCLLTAGNGAPGLAGASGSPGATGSVGGNGGQGACSSTPFVPGGPGGNGFYLGGSGGSGGNSNGNGQNGGNGAFGQGPGGGPGGAGGTTSSSAGGDGQSGVPGSYGSPGSGGATSPASGSVSGDAWVASFGGDGGNGTPGGGGGGGGGGG